MSDPEPVPPPYDQGKYAEGTEPPPYPQGNFQAAHPPMSGYPAQPPPANPGYPVQVQPTNPGYPVQPPPVNPAGYPTQPPGVYPPPGQAGVPPPGVDPNNVVVLNQPSVVIHHNLNFRDAPVSCMCPNCHNQVTSNVHREIGGLTLLIMGALCIFGLWFFCCLIPLCIDACKDAVHTCPVCNHQLGRWNQL